MEATQTNTNPAGEAGERQVPMASTTFAATVIASSAPDAYERVAKHLAKVEGFALTGNVQVRSERHLLWTVEVANLGGDVNDCWVVLTSYGISPAPELGSGWESVLGATA